MTTSNNGSAQASDDVVVNCGDIELTKVADAETVSAGDPIGFVITATNAGAGEARDVTVTDTLPTQDGLVWSHENADCSISGSTLTCNFGTLAPGASKSVHITSPTTAASCALINNEAEVSTTNDGSAQASDDVTVNCGAIELTKVADEVTVSAGDQIGFVITATNAGAGEARGVVVTDTLPTQDGLSWSQDSDDCAITAGVLTCNFGTLAPGASKSVHITSPTTEASCATIDNSASVTTTNDGSATASDDVIVNCGDIQITKVADADTVSAGDQIGFVITATNGGEGEARDVVVTDTLPTQDGLSWSEDSTDCSISGGVLTCNFGTLAAGASKSVHITSPTTAASCALIDNEANVTTSNAGEAQAEDDVTVNCGDISLAKEADAGSVNAGQQIGFTITATNNGDGDASGVTVEDELPAGFAWEIESSDGECSIEGGVLTCDFGTIGPEGSKSVHIVSPTTAETCGTVENTASVSTSNDGGDEASDSTFVDCPAIDVAKSGPATAYHGDQVTFTFKVTNTGNVPLTEIKVQDDKCPNAVLQSKQGNQDATLDPQEVWTYTCTMTGRGAPGRRGQPGGQHRDGHRHGSPGAGSLGDRHPSDPDPASGRRHREDRAGDGDGGRHADLHAHDHQPGRRLVRGPGGRRHRSALLAAAGAPGQGRRRDAEPVRSGRHVDLHVLRGHDRSAARHVRQHGDGDGEGLERALRDRHGRLPDGARRPGGPPGARSCTARRASRARAGASGSRSTPRCAARGSRR